MSARRSYVALTIFLLAFSLSSFYVLSQAPEGFSQTVPFGMTERTEYDFDENTVYLEFTDSLDKDQYITNVTLIFADSSKTRAIDITDFSLNQSYSVNDHDIVNVSSGKYKTNETNCTTYSSEANETETVICMNYYKDSDGNILCEAEYSELLTCDFIMPDKSVLKEEQQVVGSHTEYGYLGIPTTKEKTIKDGKKIEQKVEGSIPLTKGGSAQLKITTSHLSFYGITVEEWENKYNISACSQYGCVEIDPSWWDSNWDYKQHIDVNNTATEDSWIPMLINMSTLALQQAGKMEADFKDVRFVQGSTSLTYEFLGNFSGGTYWFVKPNASGWKASANTSLEVYYGYSSATNISDPKGTWNISYVWHMDADGDSIIESTGSANANMTKSGAPTYNTTHCRVGNCWRYEASGGYHTTSNVINTSNAPSFTFALWFQVDGGSNTRGIEWGGDVDANTKLVVADGTDYGLILAFSDQAWHSPKPFGVVPKETLIHLVGMIGDPDTTTCKAYIDGNLNGTDESCSGITTARILRVGGHYDTGTYNWVGLLDEMLLFNATLTAEQIRALYSSYDVNQLAFGSEEEAPAAAVFNATLTKLWLNSSEADHAAAYPADVNISATTNLTVPVTIMRDGTVVCSGTSSIVCYQNSSLLANATYNFTANFTGNATHNSSSVTYFARINKAKPIVMRQWLETPWYNGTHINITLNVFIYNNESALGWALNVYVDNNFTNYSISGGLIADKADLHSETVLFTRPDTDSWFNTSAASIGNVSGSSNEIAMILPIDPAEKGEAYSRNVTSALSVADTEQEESTLVEQISDHISSLAEWLRSLVFIKSISDLIAGADVSKLVSSLARELQNSFILSEARYAVLSFGRALSDYFAQSEVSSRILIFTSEMQDSFILSKAADGVGVFLDYFTGGQSVSDAESRTVSFDRERLDTTSLLDTVKKGISSFGRDIRDAFALGDDPARAVSLSQELKDSVILSEVAKVGRALQRSVSSSSIFSGIVSWLHSLVCSTRTVEAVCELDGCVWCESACWESGTECVVGVPGGRIRYPYITAEEGEGCADAMCKLGFYCNQSFVCVKALTTEEALRSLTVEQLMTEFGMLPLEYVPSRIVQRAQTVPQENWISFLALAIGAFFVRRDLKKKNGGKGDLWTKVLLAVMAFSVLRVGFLWMF